MSESHSQIRVVGLGVGEILMRVIVPHDDVPRVVILVMDEQAGDSRSIRNEGRIDAICVDGVLLERVLAVVTPSRSERGQHGRCGEGDNVGDSHDVD